MCPWVEQLCIRLQWGHRSSLTFGNLCMEVGCWKPCQARQPRSHFIHTSGFDLPGTQVIGCMSSWVWVGTRFLVQVLWGGRKVSCLNTTCQGRDGNCESWVGCHCPFLAQRSASSLPEWPACALIHLTLMFLAGHISLAFWTQYECVTGLRSEFTTETTPLLSTFTVPPGEVRSVAAQRPMSSAL
jgi:hypothetical protein